MAKSMITIIKDPAYKPDAPKCYRCAIRLDYDPSDVQQQHRCGESGCGILNVVICPRCQQSITVTPSWRQPRQNPLNQFGPLPPYKK